VKKIILLSIFILAFAAFGYAKTFTFGDSDTLDIEASANVEMGYIADSTAPVGQTYGIYGYNTQGTHLYGATSEDPALFVNEDAVTDGSATAPGGLSVIQGWSKLGE